MEIIALSGYARAGKDEAASVLVEEHGFTRVAFADKLREMLYALNPIVSFSGWQVKEKDTGLWRQAVASPETYVTVQNVIDNYGWDHYKETEYGDEIRRLLQRLGTEAGRQTLWDTIWIDAAFAGLPDDAKVVVSDARFFNEFDAVLARGGYVWRIERPGIGPANSHASETEAVDYDKFSLFLHNNGTLEEFKAHVSRSYTMGLYKEWSYT